MIILERKTNNKNETQKLCKQYLRKILFIFKSEMRYYKRRHKSESVDKNAN
jgi:hypothetical protein